MGDVVRLEDLISKGAKVDTKVGCTRQMTDFFIDLLRQANDIFISSHGILSSPDSISVGDFDIDG